MKFCKHGSTFATMVSLYGCFKEPSHWHGTFEYPQHMFSLKTFKVYILVCLCFKDISFTWYHSISGIRVNVVALFETVVLYFVLIETYF